jgi:hypothetical protein
MKARIKILSIIALFVFSLSCKKENTDSTLDLSVNNLDFASIPSGTASIDINSNSAWKITSNQGWCNLSDTLGSGDKVIQVSATGNISELERNAVVTIISGDITKTVSVKQKGGTLVFNEQFNDNSRGWRTSSGDSILYSISGGAYDIDNQNKSTGLSFVTSYLTGTNSVIKDASSVYSIETEIRQVSGNITGLFFGRGSSNDYYTIRINPTDKNVHFNKVISGFGQTIQTVNSVNCISTTNKIKILRNKTSLDLTINDTFVATFSIETLNGPYAGFCIYNNNHVSINYIKAFQY